MQSVTVKVDVINRGFVKQTEMRMIRWMCDIKIKELSKELRERD